MAIPGISTNDRERFIVRADEKAEYIFWSLNP
jgi:hypothetical protein